MKHTLETKLKISETCKRKGIGKWMLGRIRPEELKKRQSEIMKKLVSEGKHNFYIDGRTKLPCPSCGGKKWRSRNQCSKCAIKRKDQHWNWHGGITKENHRIRTSTPSKIWNKQVKERDNLKCKIENQDCSGKLEAHHILPFSTHPNLRFDVNNGITLCRFHHPLKHEIALKMSPYFRQLIEN